MNGKRLLVTGGAGFLGSHFIRYALAQGAASAVNLDLLTYAGDTSRLADLEHDARYRFVRGDVASSQASSSVVDEHKPQVIVHFAAESHVTRSEKDVDLFHRTNVEGTRVMLGAAQNAGVDLFLHISTDEIYGPIERDMLREQDKEPGDAQATSAYAKSKALADDLARSYSDRLPVIVARPTNVFGPHQFPEKAFARWVTRALGGEPVLVWGDGLHIRQWLYIADLTQAIGLLVEKGIPGEAYNIGPQHEPEITNLALARWLIEYLDLPEDRLVLTEYDRPEHDRRYSVDSQKMRALGWRPGDVWSQIAETVEWYRQNRDWWERHVAEAESIYTDV